jgi:hypothetical protein
MAEIVNMRMARKRQARAKAEIEAAANRIAFGVSKSQRSWADAEREQADRRLDAHRRSERGDAE